MKLILIQNLKIREESFGAIIRLPKSAERIGLTQFYQTNKLGLEILKLCKGILTERQIISVIFKRYQNKYVKSDIKEYLLKLIEIGVITVES